MLFMYGNMKNTMAKNNIIINAIRIEVSTLELVEEILLITSSISWHNNLTAGLITLNIKGSISLKPYIKYQVPSCYLIQECLLIRLFCQILLLEIVYIILWLVSYNMLKQAIIPFNFI